jgi:hypothetical protein
MTHEELVIMPRELFFLFFLNTLSYHKKCLHDIIFSANETHFSYCPFQSHVILLSNQWTRGMSSRATVLSGCSTG